jgi:poly-beta-1,6-N-acetyl-D-glucosamine synthase
VKLVVLIPAQNEEGTIAKTIGHILCQRRSADKVIVIPNGCRSGDRTAEIARSFDGVIVMELPRLEHKKSEALNRAWTKYCQDADLVVCLDADTELPANALGDWEQEFRADEELGGSSSKFTMLDPGVLPRIQKHEFAAWTTKSLRRGWTSVLAGTGCCIRGEALRAVVKNDARPGPWHYGSQTEDFELTYQIRRLGYYCKVSPTVRAYTDAMDDLASLWNQRMKWQVGTCQDLMRIGFDRLTLIDWWQQCVGIFAALSRFVWLGFMVTLLVFDMFVFQPLWLLPTALFISADVKKSLTVPERTWRDITMAALFFPLEAFAWLRACWFLAGWASALHGRMTGQQKDRWQAQYAAEGILRGGNTCTE